MSAGADDGGAADERWPPSLRLRRRAEYQRAYGRGRRRRGSLVMLVVHPNDLGHPRFGITASRKVGGAVVRNRVKRRIREVLRRWAARRALPGLDVVVHVHPRAARARFAALRDELHRLLGGLAAAGERRRRGDAEPTS